MMKQEIFDRINNDPNYILLVQKRSRLGWQLSFLMLLIYFGFVLVIAFNPAFLAQPLCPKSVVTVGIPLGLGVIMSAFVLTGIYVWRANREFDELTQKIKTNVKEVG